MRHVRLITRADEYDDEPGLMVKGCGSYEGAHRLIDCEGQEFILSYDETSAHVRPVMEL